MEKIYSLSSFVNDLELITKHTYLIFDLENREAILSNKLAHILQFSSSQNHTEAILSLLNQLDNPTKKELRKNFRRALKTGKSNYLEIPLSVNEKELKLGLESFSFQRKHKLFLAKITNISSFVSYENIPQETKNQLNFLLQTSPDPIIITSLGGKIIDLNPRSEQFLGIEKHSLKDQKIFDYIKNSGKDDFDKIVNKTIRKSKSHQNYIVFRTHQNIIRHSEASTSIIYKQESPKFVVFFLRDISERILYQRQLEQEKRKAQESDRLKTAFLGNMSHEIRTPMNAIVGFAELLNDPDTSKKERKEYINLININSYNLLDLIDDIIDVSKIEAGQIKIKKTICPLENIFNQLYNHFEEKVHDEGKPIELISDIPEEYRSLQIYSDAYHLQQALQHLIANAIKFTEQGEVSFGYQIYRDQAKSFLRFYIKDTGIGIPEDKQNAIFQRFRQVEESHIKNYSGAGLGLTISKRLVELLGGQIGLTSEPGKGSEFYFTLPLETPDIKSEKEETQSQLRNYDWSGKTILVAEDIEANYLYIEAVLIQTNANVIWSADGDQTAQKCTENSNIDLVLMDIQLPGINGYEATQVIKKHRPHLPVVALTAFASDNEKEKSIKAGCDEYISKPIKPQVLLHIMNRLL